MKKLLVILFVSVLGFGGQVFSAGPEVQTVTNIAGINADVKIIYPKSGINSADKAIKNYIIREITQFKEQLGLQLGGTSTDENMFHVDCKVVTNTSKYYSVLCDQYVYVQGARGQSVQTFNYNKQSHTSISLSSLIPENKLIFLSTNLRRHFINTLQATETEAQDRINRGITARYADFTDFTILGSGDTIQGLHLYFDPFRISGPEQGIQWVKVAYPSLRIMR